MKKLLFEKYIVRLERKYARKKVSLAVFTGFKKARAADREKRSGAYTLENGTPHQRRCVHRGIRPAPDWIFVTAIAGK